MAAHVSFDQTRVRALYLAERLDLRSFERAERLGIFPLAVRAGEKGVAVLFRYGAVVLAGVAPAEEAAFLQNLSLFLRDVFPEPEIEEIEVLVDPSRPERIEHGALYLHEISTERLQLLAEVLARSVVLARQEAGIAAVFDRIEPLALSLQKKGRGTPKERDLVKMIGQSLLVQHRMVGRVEVTEKPEILWDHPELERLWTRLGEEYELLERHLALERKLQVVSRTVETLLDLLQARQNLKVEWYILLLIAVEILLGLLSRLGGF